MSPTPPTDDCFISINGTVVSSPDDAAATISIFDTSFHRGDGVFEVMKIIIPSSSSFSSNNQPTIRSFDQHMERLQISAKTVGCPLPPLTIMTQWLETAVAAIGHRQGCLRLIATKGNDLFHVAPSVVITWSPLPQWPDTFTLYPLLAPWHPAGLPGWETPIKWTSYGPNVVSSEKAKQAGFTDALLLSPHRVERPDPPQTWDTMNIRDFHVLDGPNFAIAFVQNQNNDEETAALPPAILHLPCCETLGLLPSITQGRVASIAKDVLGMTVKRDVYTLGQLLELADEVLVMSTTRGVKRVTHIGEYSIPVQREGKNYQSLSWATRFSTLLDPTGLEI